jgi:hypothetical protein
MDFDILLHIYGSLSSDFDFCAIVCYFLASVIGDKGERRRLVFFLGFCNRRYREKSSAVFV